VAKHKQAHYYNRGAAKQRPKLPVGQTVHVRFDEKDWRKAEVSKQLPFRSYGVRFDDGTTRRRTSCHVHFSNEPPIIMREDTGIATSTPTHSPLLVVPSQLSMEPAGSAQSGNGPAPPDQRQQQQQTTQKSSTAVHSQPTTTRSGRIVHRPARYRE